MPDQRLKQIRNIFASCLACPWCEVCGDDLVCHEQGEDRIINDPEPIPEWCRLENADDDTT